VAQPHISEATLRRVRDYAVEEPSFTAPFAAWELGVSTSVVRAAVEKLLEGGVVIEIEPAQGPYAATYAYAPMPEVNGQPVKRHFPELDDARIGELAPARSKVVPHTRTEGPSGRPGRDRKRQAKGVRVKRGRVGS
jgi:hypothetical protein